LLNALYWPVVVAGVAFKAEVQVRGVSYVGNPVEAAKNMKRSPGVDVDRVDGSADGASPCVYRTGARILFARAGEPTVILGCASDRFTSLLGEGLTRVNRQVHEDQRLVTAIDLFNAFHYESSMNARFIALVMALEVLAIPASKTQVCQELLERWRHELVALLSEHQNSPDHADLEALMRELAFRKESSIRSRIRKLLASLQGALLSDQDARRAIQIYDLRGGLVHDGRADQRELSRAVSDGRRIIASILQYRLEYPIADRHA
jgi:hypothetical protein